MYKKLLLTLSVAMTVSFGMAQELNAKVTVLYGQIRTTTDRKVFQTLQTQLTNFINNRKWTNDVFRQNERIVCNFLINLQRDVETNVYQASLTVQAARPIYKSSYTSPLINFQDGDVVFKYIEFQPIEFNEARVTGPDALASNLTAVVAYYVYLILGLDYDSFSPRGGDPWFQKAQAIVANAPEGRNITGWKQFDGLRNRYWLMENLMNNRYALIHDVYYGYYRKCLDQMVDNEKQARTELLNTLNSLSQLNAINANLMAIQFFFQGKSDEIIGILKKATPQEKARALEILQRVDISNANKYREQVR